MSEGDYRYIDVLKNILKEVDLPEVLRQCEEGKRPEGIELIMIAQLSVIMDDLINNVSELIGVANELRDQVEKLRQKSRVSHPNRKSDSRLG